MTDTLMRPIAGIENRTAQEVFDIMCDRIRLSASPAGVVKPQSVEGSPLLEWAVDRWKVEVKHRPLRNVHRRSLDDVWRQVIRWAGGDPDELVGPPHDQLPSEGSAK